jgi:hypothetical protein
MTRPALRYDSPSQASSVFVNTALLHYKANQQLEFAAGRDQLPTGLGSPDLGLWIKSRNRLGHYATPIQLRMFWTHPRVHLMPFVFGPDYGVAADLRRRDDRPETDGADGVGGRRARSRSLQRWGSPRGSAPSSSARRRESCTA